MRGFLNILGISALIAVFCYSFSYKSFIRLSYEINKLEIIEKLCINKEEKSFQCDGKCHLKTQLEKSEEKIPFKDGKIVEEHSHPLYFSSASFLSLEPQVDQKQQLFFYQSLYSYKECPAIFHPPKA